jgi:multimeric flavodoxin WrbA
MTPIFHIMSGVFGVSLERGYSRSVKILALVAGTNHPSNSETLCDHFIEGAKRSGAEVEKIRIEDLALDHFTLAHYDAATDQGADYEKLKKAVLGADGVVISTPIWNFSVPAHLKNLIDRMGTFGLDEESRSLGMLKGKPFFLLYTGGSPAPVWIGLQRRTVSHMPVSIRYFNGVPVGSHYEERATLGKGKFGLIVDKRPGSLSAVEAKGEKFAATCAYFVKNGKLPFTMRLKTAVLRVGQRIKKKLGI